MDYLDFDFDGGYEDMELRANRMMAQSESEKEIMADLEMWDDAEGDNENGDDASDYEGEEDFGSTCGEWCGWCGMCS